MKLRRVNAVAKKEFLHIVRDPRSLGMAVAIPMLMLVLFGFALTVDVDNVPLVVWNQDGSQAAQELIDRFDGSPYFSIVGEIHDAWEMEYRLDRRKAIAALVIPPQFGQRIEGGHRVSVQYVVDGSDSNTAMISVGYAEAIILTYSQRIALEKLRRAGGESVRIPLDMRPRVWYNADLESRNYIIPGLIAVIMMVIASLLTSLTVAREWERGTMEQLISTPVKGPELILGKLIPYFALAMLDVVLAVLMGEYVFCVPLRGNVALLFGIGAIFLAGALSMGMLISIAAKSQLLASQLAMITTFLPAFLLSGFMVPIASMPPAIQCLTYLVPARYFVTLLHGIYLKGVGLEILGFEAMLLVLFGATTVAVANLRFKKKVS
jgi:ABC-2 type transport system permease protein